MTPRERIEERYTRDLAAAAIELAELRQKLAALDAKERARDWGAGVRSLLGGLERVGAGRIARAAKRNAQVKQFFPAEDRARLLFLIERVETRVSMLAAQRSQALEELRAMEEAESAKSREETLEKAKSAAQSVASSISGGAARVADGAKSVTRSIGEKFQKK